MVPGQLTNKTSPCRMHSKIDLYSTAIMHMRLFNQWMSMRLNLIAASFTVVLAFLVLLSPSIDASLAGFALAFALRYNTALIWTINSYANVEMDMNSMERVTEYMHLPTETEHDSGETAPMGWPSQGDLEFADVSARFAPDLPFVLKGITFTARRGERIGIVGRTGAGKSSLTLALFRFLEASQGSISIDGVDIARIRLHELRSRLAIIPQDPVLFTGTVRSNLDPEGRYSDEQLRVVLDKVFIRSSSDPANGTSAMDHSFPSISTEISSGGLNLSLGQRQLMCLACASLARPRILVLDEATSSVDGETDSIIQSWLDREFADTTVIVIAHRLSTVARFERILVMSDGEIVERGTAKELMERKGLWMEMVLGTGNLVGI